ncbi:MAG: aldo/keto reductase [Raoultibacter sp.]
MNYRDLGTTGLRVSEIGMGCEGYVDDPQACVAPLTAEALRWGINFFDLYTPSPQVHTLLGAALADVRSDVIIQGHICAMWAGGQYKRTRDITETKAAFESQLEHLGTDYLDIGMIHFVDSDADFDEVFTGPVIAYAQQLKAEGRIRHIGLSSHNPVVARRAVETGLVEVLMFSINPAYDMQPATDNIDDLFNLSNYEQPLYNIDADRDALYKLCERRGVGITVMKAFAGGRLLDAARSQFKVAMTPVQCVHYALTRPAVASVLPGFHTLEQFAQTCAYCQASDAQRDFSEVLAELPTHTFAGECMYCGHCAPCPATIDIAAVNKYLDLVVAAGSMPETVREHYASLTHHAKECIECAACETRCPFAVPVIEKMHQAADTFGK